MTDSKLIEPSDLKIESIDRRPRGGQTVGTGAPSVKVTHLPTGLSATCTIHRSQHRNRTTAIEMIEWALTGEKS